MKYLKKLILGAVLALLLSSCGLPTVQAADAEEPLIYFVRFAGEGLSIYADPSLTGMPVAVLPDSTYVQIVLGPLDWLVKVRVCGTQIEGYTDMRYLKRLDAAVYDPDVYTYEEMVEDIALLQARYPALLHVDITGQSADGRDLYLLTLGDPNAPQHVLIHAGIHAREHLNPLLVMEQVEQFLDFYGSGYYHEKSYQELFSGIAVHVIPMVNPDGIAISQSGESAIRSPELLELVRACYACDTAERRTSSSYQNYLARWKANARGVDLNRNFPFGFVAGDGVQHSSYAGYQGPAPLSEPETLSLGAVTVLYQPSVIINYHSMGEVAYWDTAENRYKQISRDFTDHMLSLIPYKRMRPGSASGSYLDWIYSLDSPVRSITFETGDVACPLPPSQYPKIWMQHALVLPDVAWYLSTVS